MLTNWLKQAAITTFYLILGGYALWRWWEEN